MPTKPMLAVDFNPSKANFPYIAMPKIDGVRALHLLPDLGITGRSLKSFGNTLVSDHFSDLPLGLDGELSYGSVTDPALCRTVTSIVSTYDDTRANSLTLNVFDYVTEETESLFYINRLHLLSNLPLPSNCRIIPHVVVTDQSQLDYWESRWLAEGYEGVILRDPYGTYKNGRTTIRENSYLRIKRFVQEDAIVLSITEAMENTNPAQTNQLGHSERSTHQANLVPKGMVGSITCRDIKTNSVITIGPGEMSHEDRIYYFNHPDQLIGKTISYKSFPKGVKDKPRFPTFVTIRPSQDLVPD